METRTTPHKHKQSKTEREKQSAEMQGIGVTTAMVAVLFLQVGLNTLIKAAITKGMSNFVYILYSNAVAFCFLLPATFVYHRKRAPPPITIWILYRIFLLSFLSCCVQTLTYNGIGYSSPTLASAMEDLIPAYTFVLAIISRMEKLDLKLRSSQSKSLGTVVSITGALTVTLYKGLPMTSGTFLFHQSQYWLFGGLLLAASSLCLSLLFIVQTWIIKEYPAELMLTTISCIFVVFLSAIVAWVAEENPIAWVLRPNVELVSIFYSAIFVISLRNVVHAWACRKKGPVYVAMFNPLGIVIALSMGVVFLGDSLYLGSIIGAVIIAIGFYAVIWGQTQEEKTVNQRNEISASVCVSSSSVAPLLQNECMGG